MFANRTPSLQAPSADAEIEQTTGLFDSSSQMFLMSITSLAALLGMAVMIGLSYQFCIYLPRKNKRMANRFHLTVNK